jgi:MFS family permease
VNRNIRTLLAASTLIHSGVNLLAPVFAIFLVHINGTLLDTGIAVGIYTILKGVFFFLFSKTKEEHLSKKAMMAWGYAIMGGVYLAYMGVQNVYQLFFLQAVLSFGESIITPSWSAALARELPEGKERDTYAQFYGYRSIFEGGAAIAGGFFAMQFGFGTLFALMAFCAFAASTLTARMKNTA